MPRALRELGVRTEMLATKAANLVWPLVRAWGERFPNAPLAPKWSPAPLAKQREKSFPPLGWPRKTDSLCPLCVREARAAVLSGAVDLPSFVHDHPGEIPADIVESEGRIVMRKTCARHGTFEDV